MNADVYGFGRIFRIAMSNRRSFTCALLGIAEIYHWNVLTSQQMLVVQYTLMRHEIHRGGLEGIKSKNKKTFVINWQPIKSRKETF